MKFSAKVVLIAALIVTAACGSNQYEEASSVVNAREQRQASLPTYFNQISQEFGEDIYVGEEIEWYNLSGVTFSNYERKVKQKLGGDMGEIAEFEAIESLQKLKNHFYEITDNSADHAQAVWELAALNGAKIVMYSSNGEDGIWLVVGFIVIDPNTGKALMLYTFGQA